MVSSADSGTMIFPKFLIIQVIASTGTSSIKGGGVKDGVPPPKKTVSSPPAR